MQSEWKEYKLGDAPIEIVDGDRGKNYPKKDEFCENGYCLFLNTKNVTTSGFSFTEPNFITKEKDKLLRKGRLKRYDLVLTTRGTVGNVGFYNDNVIYDKLRINSGMVIIRPNGIDKEFNYQLFKYLKKDFETFTTGSAQPQLPIKDLKEMFFYLPPLPEQKTIASVLSSLDDKIDLLHRQNKTLEAMAETLFRQWFVEEAQEDWETSTIGDVLQTELGGTPSTKKPEFWNGHIPWINSGEVNNFRVLAGTKFITKLGLQKSNTKLLPKGTTILAITGATLGQVSLLEIETCANQSVVGIIPNERIPNEYVFLWVKHKINEIILNETGGAQPHINKNDINHTEIIIPNRGIMKQGMCIISPLFEKITTNSFQIRTLEKMRDTLLPKLMSGEVRVEI